MGQARGDDRPAQLTGWRKGYIARLLQSVTVPRTGCPIPAEHLYALPDYHSVQSDGRIVAACSSRYKVLDSQTAGNRFAIRHQRCFADKVIKGYQQSTIGHTDSLISEIVDFLAIDF